MARAKAGRVQVFVDPKRLMRDVTRSNSINKLIADAVTPNIRQAQRDLIQEFDEHPVTVEIKAGSRTTNSSGLLDGYGNLFSFFGFYAGSKPTSVVRRILNKKIDISVRKAGYTGKFFVNLDNAPTKEEILNDKQTEITWLEGRSWVDGIEHGVSGFGRYMHNPKGFGGKSRSKTGIQYKGGEAYRGKFQTTPYISEMLRNFVKKIRT